MNLSGMDFIVVISDKSQHYMLLGHRLFGNIFVDFINSARDFLFSSGVVGLDIEKIDRNIIRSWEEQPLDDLCSDQYKATENNASAYKDNV